MTTESAIPSGGRSPNQSLASSDHSPVQPTVQRRRRRLHVWVLLIVAGLLTQLSLAPIPASARPVCRDDSDLCIARPRHTIPEPPPLPRVVDFTWRMEDRFNISGKILANPPQWTVVVNACAAAPLALGRRFHWENEGHITESNGCTARLSFSRIGQHAVTLTVKQKTRSVTSSKTLFLRDHLIVSIGDSIAAGEGAPYTARKKSKWTDGRCHRSRHAAHSEVASQIESSDPHSSVTFIHLACSGAGIDDGLINGYEGIEYTKNDLRMKKKKLDAQLDVAIAAAGGRTVDVLLLQVGANDATFSKLIARCAVTSTNCTRQGTARRAAAFIKQQLPGRYDRLAAEITQRLAPRMVLIGEYPDPLHNERGLICTGILGGINRNEALWAYRNIVRPLNEQVRAAARRHQEEGWVAVTGVEEDFLRHGYCSKKNRWIRTLSESHTLQGNKFGTLHPNRTGYQHIAARYLESVERHKVKAAGVVGALSNPGMEAGRAGWAPGNGTDALRLSYYARPVAVPKCPSRRAAACAEANDREPNHRPDYVPYAGRKLMAASTGAAGRSVAQEVWTIEPVGATVTFSAWLRAPKQGQFNGTLAIWALGNQDEVATVPFSVGPEWTRVEVTLTVHVPGHSVVKPEIYLDTVGRDLLIDSAELV